MGLVSVKVMRDAYERIQRRRAGPPSLSDDIDSAVKLIDKMKEAPLLSVAALRHATHAQNCIDRARKTLDGLNRDLLLFMELAENQEQRERQEPVQPAAA